MGRRRPLTAPQLSVVTQPVTVPPAPVAPVPVTPVSVTRPRSRREPRPVTELGPVEQVRFCLKRGNRLPFALGSLLGAVVPIGSWQLAHHEIMGTVPLYAQLPTYLVLGALLFSSLSVYQWGKLAFRSGAKALGFCILLEGILVASSTHWLSLVALGYLVTINAVATATNLVHRRQ